MARAFERPATIALAGPAGAKGEVLEGLHVPAEPAAGGAVIAPPHPLYGGSMDSPVVTEIAHACQHAGISSLRFNWRGVGASAGETTGDPAVAEADYAASLDWVEESVAGAIVACGYSFGAATAVRAAAKRERVKRLLLVAPPPSMLDRAQLDAFGGEVFVVVGNRDEFAPHEELRAAVESLPRSSFELLRDVDHFFMNGLAEVGRAARGFLER